MKNYIFIVILVLVAFHSYGKKEKVNKDAKIDSLTKANLILSTELDSVSKELVKYFGVYKAVREKVMKRDFDPTTMSAIIDSLSKGREAAFAGMSASTAYLRDSIVVLKNEIAQMKSVIDNISNTEKANNRLVAELKQLKELLDEKIISQADYDAKKNLLLHKWQ